MEKNCIENLARPNMWALILGLSAIVCVAIISCSVTNLKSTKDTVSVTGQGCREMRSDWIVWNGEITAFDSEAKTDCAEKLAYSRMAVAEYIQQRGIDSAHVQFSSIDVSKEEKSKYNSDGDYIGLEFIGYKMTQLVTIQSNDIDKVKEISRDITSLLSDGVDISSNSPSYYLKNLGDLKLTLIDEATENAKVRAKKLIKGFAHLKDIDDIDVGVFQITGLYSNDEYSYGGSYNTSSEWKQVSVTVHASYGIK